MLSTAPDEVSFTRCRNLLSQSQTAPISLNQVFAFLSTKEKLSPQLHPPRYITSRTAMPKSISGSRPGNCQDSRCWPTPNNCQETVRVPFAGGQGMLHSSLTPPPPPRLPGVPRQGGEGGLRRGGGIGGASPTHAGGAAGHPPPGGGAAQPLHPHPPALRWCRAAAAVPGACHHPPPPHPPVDNVDPEHGSTEQLFPGLLLPPPHVLAMPGRAGNFLGVSSTQADLPQHLFEPTM